MKRVSQSFLFKIVVIMFIFFCVLTVVKLQIEINEISYQKEEILLQNEKIQDQIDEINSNLSEPKDQAYYEDMARDKLNLRLPEEIIFYNDLIN